MKLTKSFPEYKMEQVVWLFCVMVSTDRYIAAMSTNPDGVAN